jgi:CheY-like chemotaxis protein
MGSALVLSKNIVSEIAPMRIMIVEDQQCLTHLYYWILDKHLHPIEAQLFWTENAGREAIKSIQSGNIPDFAILDIKINGVNGIDVFKELRKVSNIPIVFLTGAGNDEREYKEAVAINGKDGVVKKDQVRFFEDLLPKIPNFRKYLRCNINCLRNNSISCFNKEPNNEPDKGSNL